MKVSYKWLETYFKEPLPAVDKVAELLSAHAFEVEGIEKTGADTVLDLKILPDRAHYALCHRGIAREIGALINSHIERKVRKDAPFDAGVQSVPVVLDTKLCRRYTTRRIDGVCVGGSPKDIATNLESVGARSINNIVDATNFVMFDIGQPLHAFDADKVKGPIKVRMAHAGEKITILDSREMELRETDMVIADDLGALAIAGVKGGKRAEVTAATTSIILESANFDPVSVRRTATRLNLRNDSSKRFENEITPFLAYEALDRVTKLILDMIPEARVGVITDIYPEPVQEWSIECDAVSLRAIIGVNISSQKMEEILTSLDIRVVRKEDILHITPPLERLDIKIPEDIADEIARIYGYEKIEAKVPPVIADVPCNKTFYYAEYVKNILAEQGYSETLLYTLAPKGAFEISYPLASDKSALRESLVSNISKSLVMNARNADLLGLDAIKIFEIGTIFPKTGEKTSLCVGAFTVKKKKGVTAESILTETLAILEQKLGVKIESKAKDGVIEIDFDALVAKLPEPKSIADLGFSSLSQETKYKPFSPYPYIVRDIALFAPVNVSESTVLNLIKETAAKSAGALLVKGPELFDRFEKDGKVSYAFRMIFQSFERTLSDEEVNGFMTKVYDVVKTEGWQTR